MKKIFTFISGFLLLHGSASLNAQSFKVQDTIKNATWIGGPSAQNIEDAVINQTADSIIISWKVIGTDFPADWQTHTGICDNNVCYTLGGLWPSGASMTSNKYGPSFGDFHLQVSGTATTIGTHYVTVRMHNNATPSDSTYETFNVTNIQGLGVPSISSPDEVRLYPNPASNELNIVYDANADIKNIAVYNIIGKVMTVYKVTGNNSANLDLENIPSGIYFVRLVNAHGAVVATRKFTKQ